MEQLPQFNIVDVAVLIVILLGTIRGYVKGLSRELAGLLSAAFALFAGWYLYRPAGEAIANATRLSGHAAYTLAFFLLLVVGYLAMHLLRFLLKAIMEFSFKPGIERIGGILAGFTRITVFCAALLLLMGLWPNPYIHRLFAEDSLFGRAAFSYLGPVYDSLSEKYPALRIPREDREDEDMGEYDDEGDPRPDFENGGEADAGY